MNDGIFRIQKEILGEFTLFKKKWAIIGDLSNRDMESLVDNFQRCSKMFGIKVEEPIFVCLRRNPRLDDYLNELEDLKNVDNF